MHRKIINALMKWLVNTVRMCLLLTILRLESFVETGVRDCSLLHCRLQRKVKITEECIAHYFEYISIYLPTVYI